MTMTALHLAKAESTPADTSVVTDPFAEALSWDDLMAVDVTAPTFLINPFVPVQGVTFCYGKKGVGKSPFSWEAARAVALGRPFIGHWPTQQGVVLYIELDTPGRL